MSSGAFSDLHQLSESRASRPSIGHLSFFVSLRRRESGCQARDCRTTKSPERDGSAASAANAAGIRLCMKTDPYEVPELARQFARPRRQKLQQCQIFSSWRREPDSNHESGCPYPFKKSNEFRKLRTGDLLLRADVMRRRSRPLARPVRARTSKTD